MADNEYKAPLVFANKAIQRFIKSLVGGDTPVLPDDYMAMRVVFRHCRGSWEQVAQGNVTHTRLLAKIVAAWGRRRGKRRKVLV